MNEDPFAFMDATEQAELVRKGEVKPITEHKEYDVGEKPELIELE